MEGEEDPDAEAEEAERATTSKAGPKTGPSAADLADAFPALPGNGLAKAAATVVAANGIGAAGADDVKLKLDVDGVSDQVAVKLTLVHS